MKGIRPVGVTDHRKSCMLRFVNHGLRIPSNMQYVIARTLRLEVATNGNSLLTNKCTRKCLSTLELEIAQIEGFVVGHSQVDY